MSIPIKSITANPNQINHCINLPYLIIQNQIDKMICIAREIHSPVLIGSPAAYICCLKPWNWVIPTRSKSALREVHKRF